MSLSFHRFSRTYNDVLQDRLFAAMTSLAIPTLPPSPDLPAPAVEEAERHLRDVLGIAIEHGPGHAALVVYDTRTGLARALTEAYRRNLPGATFIDFDAVAPDEVLAAFRRMAPRDLVVLVQSTNFRLEAFRIRVELFKLGLKVVEHVHLSRMPGAQAEHYIEALAYDPAYFRGVGKALKARIDAAPHGRVCGGGEELVFASRFEPAKLNVGDYSEMNNVGGQFPIGEVFTEALDLEAVSGRVQVHVFGDTSYRSNRPVHPITLVVERGRVIDAVDATPEFREVLDIIRRDEGEVWVRELGFGLNRAFTRERRVDDIGTYERMCGIHLSLGAKHGVYPKPGFKRKDARYHIDVFAVTDAVYLGDERVFANGAWTV
jgi:leucyl aminopeptidase (aminopeptidase T)